MRVKCGDCCVEMLAISLGRHVDETKATTSCCVVGTPFFAQSIPRVPFVGLFPNNEECRLYIGALVRLVPSVGG